MVSLTYATITKVTEVIVISCVLRILETLLYDIISPQLARCGDSKFIFRCKVLSG